MDNETNEQTNGGADQSDKEADENASAPASSAAPDSNAVPGAAFTPGAPHTHEASVDEGTDKPVDETAKAGTDEPDMGLDLSTDPVSVLRALADGTISRDEAREYLDENYPV